MLESDTCTEDNDDKVTKGNFVIVKVEEKSREVRYIAYVVTIVDGYVDTIVDKEMSL